MCFYTQRVYLIIRALFNALYDLMQHVKRLTLQTCSSVNHSMCAYCHSRWIWFLSMCEITVFALFFVVLWFLTREGVEFIMVIVSPCQEWDTLYRGLAHKMQICVEKTRRRILLPAKPPPLIRCQAPYWGTVFRIFCVIFTWPANIHAGDSSATTALLLMAFSFLSVSIVLHVSQCSPAPCCQYIIATQIKVY